MENKVPNEYSISVPTTHKFGAPRSGNVKDLMGVHAVKEEMYARITREQMACA